jgi:hypothetical protein
LVLGDRQGLCVATYRFPIFKPKGGLKDISKVTVNVYGGLLSGGPAVKVNDSSYVRIRGDVHQSFTGKAIVDLLGESEGPLYWLTVEVNATMGALDLADVYVSYDCASVPRSLLRRFHDIPASLWRFSPFRRGTSATRSTRGPTRSAPGRTSCRRTRVGQDLGAVRRSELYRRRHSTGLTTSGAANRSRIPRT